MTATSVKIGGVDYIDKMLIEEALLEHEIENGVNNPSSDTFNVSFVDENKTIYNSIQASAITETTFKFYWDGDLAFDGFVNVDTVSHDYLTGITQLTAYDKNKYYLDKMSMWDITQLYYTIDSTYSVSMWGRTFAPTRADFASGTMNVNNRYKISDLVRRMISDVTGLSSGNIIVTIPNDSLFWWSYDQDLYGNITTVKKVVKKKYKFKFVREAILRSLRPVKEWAELPSETEVRHSYSDLIKKFAEITGCIYFYAQGKFYFVSRQYDFSSEVTKPTEYVLAKKTIRDSVSLKKKYKYDGILLKFSNNTTAGVYYDGTNYYYNFSIYGNSDTILINGHYVTYVYSDAITDEMGHTTNKYNGFESTTAFQKYNTKDMPTWANVIEIEVGEGYSNYWSEPDFDGTPTYTYDEDVYTTHEIYVTDLQALLNGIWENYNSITQSADALTFKTSEVDIPPIWVDSDDNSMNLFPADFTLYNVRKATIDFIEETAEIEVDL